MTDHPTKLGLAMPVADLAASTAFYIDCLGCTLAQQQPAPDIAHLIDSNGDAFLLVGPQAGDLTPFLHEEGYIAKPRETFQYDERNLDARYAHLQQQGLTGVQIVVRRWGDRTMKVIDPDGYVLLLYSAAQRSSQETLALFVKGPDELEAALHGLSEADFDLVRANGEWSIRTIVHHLADSTIFYLPAMKMALTESSRIYSPNWTDSNEIVAEKLNYAGQPIGPSLAFFRAFHSYVMHLVQGIPDTWERSVQSSDGSRLNFGSLVDESMTHTLEHIDEILEIRRLHGV
jgi:catechol 2,3-dioxygenase-like lactoylglutathione lyase family enzyme